jgi:hypothetical protein
MANSSQQTTRLQTSQSRNLAAIPAHLNTPSGPIMLQIQLSPPDYAEDGPLVDDINEMNLFIDHLVLGKA